MIFRSSSAYGEHTSRVARRSVSRSRGPALAGKSPRVDGPTNCARYIIFRAGLLGNVGGSEKSSRSCNGTAPVRIRRRGSSLSALSGDVHVGQPNHSGAAQQSWDDPSVRKENAPENASEHQHRRDQYWTFHYVFLTGVLIIGFPRRAHCTPPQEFEACPASH